MAIDFDKAKEKIDVTYDKKMGEWEKKNKKTRAIPYASTPVRASDKRAGRSTYEEKQHMSGGKNKSNLKRGHSTPQTLPRADEAGSALKFAGQALLTGIAGFNGGIMQGIDFLLPDALTPEFVQKGMDWYKNDAENQQKKLEEMQDSKGKEIVGTLISGTAQTLPNAALALMSGGVSLGAQSAAIGAETATGISALTNTAAAAAKNPAFWTSFLQTAGPTYEKEKEQGASELKASASALANGLVGSAIELGGGIEKFNPNQSALKALLKTAAEEGSEEIKQYAAENLINKALGSNTAKWVSNDVAEDAVINPKAAAIQGAYGAGIGAIMGGGQRLAFRGISGKKDIPMANEPASNVMAKPSVSSEEATTVKAERASIEPRIVNGKVKYVKVNNTANQTAGKDLPFADSEVRDIPFANSTNVTTPNIMTPEIQQKIFFAVEKRSGAKIVRADLPEGVDGKYENGVITISNTAKNPAYTVLKHELTHHIETSGNYQELSDFIERNMREAGYDVEGAINKIALDYKRAGKELSPEQAKKEFVAKFSEEYLFNSEKSIERLARENPNVFRQIYDWIVDTVRKIGASEETKFLIDAQRKYEKALRTVGKNTTGETQYLFAGRRALTANETLRQTAEDMLKAGKTPQEVWQATGWKYGLDQKWKYEIDDSKMIFDKKGLAHMMDNEDFSRYRKMSESGDFFNPDFAELDSIYRSEVTRKKTNLSHFIKHDELFYAYPQLRNTSVEFVDNLKNDAGREIGGMAIGDSIKINNNFSEKEQKKTLIHEIQHIIQQIEDFEKGGDYHNGLNALRKRAIAAIENEENGRYSKEYLELRELRFEDQKDGGNRVERYIDDFLKKGYNTDDINEVARQGYYLLAGEKEARAASERLYYDVSDRRRNFPDYDGSAITYKTYSDSGQIGEALGEVDFENVFKRNSTQNVGQRTEADTKYTTKNGQRIDRLDEQRVLLGSDRVKAAGYKPAFSMPLEQRVTGDALLDAQDTIEVVKSVGGNTDDNGYVTLYHRTSKENADKIKKSGKMSAKEDGIFFSTQKSGYNDGYGDSVVELKIPAEKLVLDDIFDNEAHFRIPLKNKDAVLDVSGYLVDDAYSAGKTLESTDYTRRLQQTSQNLYGETGNKYLYIPKADETMPKQSAAEPKAKPEPVKAPRGSVKARGYERRKVNHLKQNIKASLGVNKYSDNAKMNSLIDDAVEKMKNGRLSDSEKNALFDTLFEEGIITDTTMLDRYADLKRDLRNTAIKVTDDIKANIPDFQNFRQRIFGKLRLNDAEGMAVDDLYTGLRMQYPELFPELNTTSEMVQRLAEVAGSIKQTETRLTQAFSADLETLRAETKVGFDAAMDEMEKQVNIVSKYLSRPTVISSDEAAAYARNIKQIERDIEKLNSKILLDDEDRGIVEMLLKGQIRPENVGRYTINSDNVLTVYEAKAKLQAARKGLADIRAKTRAEYTHQAENAIDGSELWQDRMGIRMSRETPERVMYDIAGKKSGQKLIDTFIRPIHEAEAMATRLKKELRSVIKGLNISIKPQYEVYPDTIEAPGLKEEHLNEIKKTGKIKLSEADLVQLYGEKLIDADFLTSVGADVPKIQNAVTTMRQHYNQLLDAVNQVLIRHGYEPIEYRKDYFPHFSDERPDGVLASIGRTLGIDAIKDELPTDIAGLTHTFRPGKKWFGNAFERTGKYTEYDAIKGYDRYIEGIADVIYHTESIQKLRTLEETIRFKHSSDGVKKQILELNKRFENGEISEVTRDADAAKIYASEDTNLGSFATWLREYTDSLAGKKTSMDRWFESRFGRTLFDVTRKLENKAAANTVAINLASWTTNFIPLVQAGEVKTKNMIKGMAQTIDNYFHHDNFSDASAFLTNRKGSDVLWKTTSDKVQDFLTSPMKFIDEFTSESITRAKYLEEIDKGYSPAEAMRMADDLAASIIADRSKGALPNAFNHKNPFVKLFTMYQVEVNNQWSHLLKDIPRTEGNVKRVALAYTKFFVFSYLFNDIYEYLIGRRPALDPISWVNDFVGDTTGKKVPNFMEAIFEGAGFEVEKKTPKAARANLKDNIQQDIPFVSGFFDGGRLPINSAIPDFDKLEAAFFDSDVPERKANYDKINELAKPLAYMALPYGGGQLKKIAEGTETFIRKGNYAVNNDGEDELRYAVDPTAGNLTKGLLFGRYSMGNADEYIDSGFKRLSEKNTKAYKAALEAGASPQETENFLRSLKGKGAAEIRNAIIDSEFTVKQKNAIGAAMEDKKSIDYSSRTSYNISLLSREQKEKIKALNAAGLSNTEAYDVFDVYRSGGETDIEKAMELLTKAEYKNQVFNALGISDNTADAARLLTESGVTSTQLYAAKLLANTNGNSNISKAEAIAYLNSKNLTRQQKYALFKAMVPNVKEQNNPYR